MESSLTPVSWTQEESLRFWTGTHSYHFHSFRRNSSFANTTVSPCITAFSTFHHVSLYFTMSPKLTLQTACEDQHEECVTHQSRLQPIRCLPVNTTGRTTAVLRMIRHASFQKSSRRTRKLQKPEQKHIQKSNSETFPQPTRARVMHLIVHPWLHFGVILPSILPTPTVPTNVQRSCSGGGNANTNDQ